MDEVLSIITNDVDTLQVSFNQAITQAITSITTIVGILVMMLSINVPMTFLVLLLVPLSLVFMAGTIKKSQKYFKANQEYLGHVNGNIEEMFSGHDVVVAFNAEEKYMNIFKEIIGTFMKPDGRVNFYLDLCIQLCNLSVI